MSMNIDRSKFQKTSPSKYSFACKTIATEEQLKARIDELAAQIAADYKGKVSKANPLVLLCVLKGSYIFTADLSRALFRRGVYTVAEFICVSSYHGTTESSGEVKLLLDSRLPLEDRQVLFVEDILDTAHTLTFLNKVITNRKPASLKTIVLLDKPEGRVVPFVADYVGFTIAKEFVIGYGLDFDEMYRDIPEVVVLKPDEYMTPAPTKSKL